VTHALYLLWWVQEKHVPAVLVATLLAAGDLVVMALEVPTGWLADRFGDRRSMIAGSAVQVCGMLACWLLPGVSSPVAGSLLIAVGDALRSGADQALLYRSCAADLVPDQFQRIEARTRGVGLIALVLLTISGGVLVQGWGWHVAWALDTALCAAGIALALAMTSPPDVRESSAEDAPAGGLLSMRGAAVVLPAGIVGAASSAFAFLVQAGADASPAAVSWTVAALVLAEAVGLALGGRLPSLPGAVQVLVAVVSVLAIAGSTVMPAPALVGTALALSFAAGALEPWRAVAIQRLAADRLRATAASLTSACDIACSMLLLPLAGFLQRRHRR
jgi:hypothetical protein